MNIHQNKSLLTDLRARGAVHDLTQGTEAQLAHESTRIYLGIDATASSLHIGNLSVLMLLKQLQRAGHRPYLILGGATSLVGDPSFRKKGRDTLDIEELRHNQSNIQAQLEMLFDVNGKEANSAVILDNYDWLHKISFLTFLREVGKYLTVNYMTGKEAVKKRIEKGMSYTEFAYQLLQGYDFYHLYTEHNVKMQLGGADQWANITTGTELIRKKANGTAFALTTPLLTRADGTKFGKTADGENIWLDPTMTSPYQFYQFFLNRSDIEAKNCIYRMTLHPLSTLHKWEAIHAEAPHKRLLQKELAKAVTTLIHGKEGYEQALTTSSLLFSEKPITAHDDQLSEADLLKVLSGIPQITLSQKSFQATSDILTLLTTTTEGKIFSSKRVAREMILAGAVHINKKKVTMSTQPLSSLPIWRKGRYILVQKGKKEYFLICCINS